MPTYNYKCDSCGKELEVVQKMSDDKLTKCPSCEKDTLVRQITANGGFVLKGSGWFGKGGSKGGY